MDAKDLPKEPAEADLPADAIGPRIWGVVDVLRKGRVAGWAIDRSDSGASVEIDIRYEGRLVKTVKADRHRPDLVKGGVGTGSYGFAAEIDPPIDPDFAFTVTATARTSDGEIAALKRVGAAASAIEPESRVMRRLFEEVLALRQASESQQDGSPNAALNKATGRLQGMIERIELAQIRLDAATSGLEPPTAADPSQGLRRLVGVALVVAIASLALGIYSLWSG